MGFFVVLFVCVFITKRESFFCELKKKLRQGLEKKYKKRKMLLSDEQANVVAEFTKGNNIVVNAVAGAGKTTTLLACANSDPGKDCLLLTYNKRLQLEVADRAAKCANKHVTVSTYHAAAGRAYQTLIRTDRDFADAVVRPPENPHEFDVLMLDEAQDLIVVYFAFLRHLLRANPRAQVIVVGDHRQTIGQYKGARKEFLTQAPELFGGARSWVKCSLRESYRLTPLTAEFVNAELFNEQVLVGKNLSNGKGIKPVYHAVAGDVSALTKALGKVVLLAVEEHGAENVFVLAPSVRDLGKKRSPLAMLVKDHLNGVPTFVTGDEQDLDARASEGKLVIMTFNASKGCERACVILTGFDEGYFRFFDRSWLNPNQLPNVLTVAATRAKTQLIIVASADQTLRTCKTVHHTATLVGAMCKPRVKKNKPMPKRCVKVKDLLRHITVGVLQRALSFVTVEEAEGDLDDRLCELEESGFEDFDPTVKFDKHHESLGFVYGSLACVLAEISRTGTTKFGRGLEKPKLVHSYANVDPFENCLTYSAYRSYPAVFWEYLQQVADTAVSERTHVQWAVLAITSHAFIEGRHHIARQVKHYEWLNSALLVCVRETVLAAIPEGGQFSVMVGPVALPDMDVFSVVDFVDEEGCMWFFSLAPASDSEVLQLACCLALKGGGKGFIVALLERTAKCVQVKPENAEKLLLVLTMRSSHSETESIASIVAGL